MSEKFEISLSILKSPQGLFDESEVQQNVAYFRLAFYLRIYARRKYILTLMIIAYEIIFIGGLLMINYFEEDKQKSLKALLSK